MSTRVTAFSHLLRSAVLVFFLAPGVFAFGDTLYVAYGRPPKQTILPIPATITDIHEHNNVESLFYDVSNSGSQIKPLTSIVRIEVEGNDAFNLAEVQCEKGDTPSAIKNYRKALQQSDAKKWMWKRATSRVGYFRVTDFTHDAREFVDQVRSNPKTISLPGVPSDLTREEIAQSIEILKSVPANATAHARVSTLLLMSDLYQAAGDSQRAARLRDDASNIDEDDVPKVQHAPGAQPIVIILDASGSMINKMAMVKYETAKIIDGLGESQWFNLIYFQDNKTGQCFEKEPRAATAPTKALALNFLENVMTNGTTDPIPAFEAAFAMRPNIIYFFTDGDFPDNDAVFGKLRQLNYRHRTTVNTIGSMNEGDTDAEFRQVLKRLAELHGGSYREIRDAPAETQPTTRPN